MSVMYVDGEGGKGDLRLGAGPLKARRADWARVLATEWQVEQRS